MIFLSTTDLELGSSAVKRRGTQAAAITLAFVPDKALRTRLDDYSEGLEPPGMPGPDSQVPVDLTTEAAAEGSVEPERHDAGSTSSPAYLRGGDIFRTLGLPETLVVGLDAVALTTKKRLSGFRDIPPGAHLLWVQQPDGVSRCGYWFVTGVPGIVHTEQWDPYHELLVHPTTQDGNGDGDDIERVYPTLQPYSLHDHNQHQLRAPGLPSASPGDIPLAWAQSPARLWTTLTSAISNQYLNRVTGRGDSAREFFVDSTDVVRDTPAAPTSTATSTSGLSFLFAQDIRDLQVLDLGSLRSRVADTSARIEAVLLADHSATTTTPTDNLAITERDILAEMQFTFLTGTHLGNPACLEQWWNLVLKMVLRAHSLAVSRPLLARDLLRTLHAQLFYTERYVGDGDSSSSSSSALAAMSQGGVPIDSRGAVRDDLDGDRPIFEYKPQNKERLRRALAEYKRQLGAVLGGKKHSELEPAQQEVHTTFEELEVWLSQYNWKLQDGHEPKREVGEVADSDEEEDEQPVIVEFDEEGREVGLVSFGD